MGTVKTTVMHEPAFEPTDNPFLKRTGSSNGVPPKGMVSDETSGLSEQFSPEAERRSPTVESLFRQILGRFEPLQPLLNWAEALHRRLARVPLLGALTRFWLRPLLWLARMRHDLTRLKWLMGQDPLTGIMNRGKFDADLQQVFMRAREQQIPLTLMMVDCDRFKDINDRFGHDAGDKVLQKVAQTLHGVTNAAYRFGGEEFVILLPEVSKEKAITAARRILYAVNNTYRETILDQFIRDQVKYRPDGKGRDISVSIGMVIFDGKTPLPRAFQSATQLLLLSDKLLYQAKRERNRAIFLSLTGETRPSEGPGLIVGPEGLRLPGKALPEASSDLSQEPQEPAA